MATRITELIDKTLATSPVSRAIHDRFFPERQFIYAMTDSDDTHAGFVAIDAETDMLRVVVNIEQDDQSAVSTINHELTHINQIINARDIGLHPDPKWLTREDYTACKLIQESQAFANEIEGPATGYLGEVARGDVMDTAFYARQLSGDLSDIRNVAGQTKLFLDNYLEICLVSTDPDVMLNEAAQVHRTHLQTDTPSKTAERIACARVALIQEFFDPQIETAELRDSYVRQSLDVYAAANYHGVNTLMLDRIVQMTALNGAPYLSAQDWQKAMAAETASEFGMNTIHLNRNDGPAV